MRIALVHYTAAPIIGGVERVMEEHARLFAANGHDVTVLCLRGGDERAVLLPGDNSAEAQAAALRPVLSEQEIVFVHNVMTMPFHPGLTEALSRMADELPHVRFVAWVHDVAACNPDYPDTAPILRRAHPRFEYVAVSSLRSREFAMATRHPVDRCRTVPNGIDPARVLGLPENVADFAHAHRLFDGRMVLLHPARLVRRKNIETSLAVADEFAKRQTLASVLVTAANDPHQEDAAAYFDELRSKSMRGDGLILVSEHLAVGDHELAAVYRLADALLFPSPREGFGLPLIEAAMHRLPVFCSDIEPLRGLLAENVTLFPPDAKGPQIAALIEATLEASPTHRERKRVLREYGWPSIYERHLAPLLAGRG
jgi:glycosyltransferase involved in cell wall biosynthesis